MRRVNTRGIKQANKCIIMSAVAYNLKKLLKWQQRKIKTTAMALKKVEKSLCSYFFTLLQPRQADNRVQLKFILC
jgi:rRNA-processing protein FCF1